MNSNNSAYRAALDKRALERAKHEESAATLARAERIKTGAAERVRELEQALETAEAEQAQRLEAAIAAGGPSDALPPSSLDAHAIAQELASAKLHASISGKALKSIEAAHAKAQADLRSAETSVIAEVDKILDEEQRTVARQVQRLLDEAVKIGKPLFLEALGFDLNTRRKPDAEVSAALVRLDPLIDRMHIANNLTKTGDTKTLARHAARRASMIAGEEFPPAASAAA